jgi:hypothetical protein
VLQRGRVRRELIDEELQQRERLGGAAIRPAEGVLETGLGALEVVGPQRFAPEPYKLPRIVRRAARGRCRSTPRPLLLFLLRCRVAPGPPIGGEVELEADERSGIALQIRDDRVAGVAVVWPVVERDDALLGRHGRDDDLVRKLPDEKALETRLEHVSLALGSRREPEVGGVDLVDELHQLRRSHAPPAPEQRLDPLFDCGGLRHRRSRPVSRIDALRESDGVRSMPRPRRGRACERRRAHPGEVVPPLLTARCQEGCPTPSPDDGARTTRARKLEEETMASPFIYAELHSNDVQRAREFYARLFDWKITEVPVPGKYYAEIGPGGGFPGGLTAALPEHEKFTGWLSYVKVKDLTAATEQARKLGATVVREDVKVPNEGRFSWIVDPAGAPLGLWEPMAR